MSCAAGIYIIEMTSLKVKGVHRFSTHSCAIVTTYKMNQKVLERVIFNGRK